MESGLSSPTSLDPHDLLNRAIEAHYAEVMAAVRGRGHSGSAATEIVHDLYLKLIDRPELLSEKRSLKAFLCRAAVNLGIDRLRRRTFETRLFSGTEAEALLAPAETAAPDQWLEVEARLAILRQAIGELPARRRAVFVLHRLRGLEPAEIAERLSISRNMVDRHLRRALAHCLDRLMDVD